MAFEMEFVPLELEDLRTQAQRMKDEGARFIQTHAVNTDDGVDLYYSWMVGKKVVNYQVKGVKPEDEVPSITDLFLAAFVFENEARELFGVDMRDIAIDFGGKMYDPAESVPMTFISPEQQAEKEKVCKVAAALAAKAAKAAKEAAAAKAAEEAQAAGDAATQQPVDGKEG